MFAKPIKNAVDRIVAWHCGMPITGAVLLPLLIACLCWRPALVFIVPGVLVLFSKAFKKIDIISLYIYIIGLSLAFWVSSFWLLRYFPLGLMNLVIIVTALTILASIYHLCCGKMGLFEVTVECHDILVFLFFVGVLVLRFAPVFYTITAPGADMSMHTYMTWLILNADGVPKDYHPLLGIDDFGSLVAGFPTISALISLLGGMEPYRSTLVMTCLTYAGTTACLYAFLRRHVSWAYALVSSACFSFFTTLPQAFCQWGSNPAVLALDFLILFVSLFSFEKNRPIMLYSAAILASVFFTHSAIFMQSAYIVGLSFIPYLLMGKEYKAWKHYAGIAIVFLALITPFMAGFDFGIETPETLEWIRNWLNQGITGVWTSSDFAWTIPEYIISGVGIPRVLLFLSLAGSILMLLENPKIGAQYTAYLAACVLVILNTKYWVLPLSYALYPEKTATMAVLPLSLFFAFAFEATARRLRSRKGYDNAVNLFTFGIIAAVLIFMPAYDNRYYHQDMITKSQVTHEDLEAFGWLAQNTAETDVIRNNYGDAGTWIPAMIYRPVTNAHIDYIYLGKVRSLGPTRYVYVGGKCGYDCPIKNSDLENESGLRRVYSRGGVNIYEVLP